ncbi:hypothetical protein HBE96_04005 [Clostridium sp. P21]|uniref:Uncharacterized protein n=1 Tax=Clostridium muellerianum TaxID=2716538 RepID=A0A7Y0HNQ3_9CLOT|nr:hypothetical protein [Clostridium muellerianum]NMM61863.1 hypothetical protein [Clostridium muellerianum]
MIKRKTIAFALSSIMILSMAKHVLADNISELNNISDNSLVIGKNLFQLDNMDNSNYNLNTFIKASKTVDDKNGVYYKYNGKWYTGNDIESFTNLKNGTPLDTIPNDILQVNGEDVENYKNHDSAFDWYQDGDYSHDEDGDNESIEQFVVVFNKNINPNKGTLKIIVPDNEKKDPYGIDKLGEININLDGKSKPEMLQNVEGGSPVTCYVIKNKENTDRLVLELTEDWTRILNTEKTGLNYYDNKIKGLRLVAEGLEDQNGNKIIDNKGSDKLTAKRDIRLAKDNEKPKVVHEKTIYTYIGENGLQSAGNTRLVFNEPVQIFTEDMVSALKKANTKLPAVVGYNPLTPSQEQLKDNEYGLPVFSAEYYKVDDNGKNVLDSSGKPITIKGKYALMGDILESGAESHENGEKIAFRLDQIPFKYDFDSNNKGITRFRDIGSFLINPVTSLTEGKWKLVVKNFTDEAGNTMEDFMSDSIEVKPYFSVEKLTEDGIKVHFTDPFAGNKILGNKVIIVITKDNKIVASTYLENLQNGQTEAEGKFKEPIKDLKGTYIINNIEYTVSEKDLNVSENTKDKLK